MNFEQFAKQFDSKAPKALATLREKQSSTERIERRIRSEEHKIHQYGVEVHKKYSIPFACIIFVLIGAPLGIMARKGGLAVGISYSLVFFIIYWAFLIGGETLADKLIISPWVAMWSGNILIGLCGIYFIVRMIRETRFISFAPIIKLFSSAGKSIAGKRSPLAFFSSLIGTVFKLPILVLNRTIGILPVYILKRFLGLVFSVQVSFSTVFIIIDYVSNIKRFESGSLVDVLLYYWYYTPWLITTFLPIVVLLSTMFCIGTLAKYLEITAIKAAGISMKQTTLPLLICGALLAGGSFYIAENIQPDFNRARLDLQELLKDRRSGNRLGSNRGKREFRRNFYYFGNKNTIYQFEEFRTNPQSTKNVWRESFEQNRITQRIQAKSLNYDTTSNSWYFVDGFIRDYGQADVQLIPFDTLQDSILSSTPDEMIVRIKGIDEMSYYELAEHIEKIKKRGEKVDQFMGDLHFKIALPFMNAIVVLLGVAVSARIGRKGGAVLFGIGLGITFLYWILSQFTLSFAKNGQFDPFLGAWLGNAVFFTLGSILYIKDVK